MRRRRNRDHHAEQSLERHVELGWSVLATLEGLHRACRRRGCREAGRCTAFTRGESCGEPLPAWADRAVAGMLAYAAMLAEGKARRPR